MLIIKKVNSNGGINKLSNVSKGNSVERYI